MNTEFFTALELLEKEKGIPQEYLLEKIEAALLSAYKKEQNGNTNARIELNPQKKDVRIYMLREVVEEVEDPQTQISLEDAQAISRKYDLGKFVETELKTKSFRRLSAQAAKQVIIQGIREAERNNMIREYENKREEIITAVVNKVDISDGGVVLETGTSHALLPRSEQIPGEQFEVGDHVKVFVCEVRKETRGPLVTLSRIHPGLVKRLFELEVPEIRDGIVLIKGISREAGARTKIAVESRDPDVDPIGACIGEHRMRINGIMKELRGEKIDLIKYNENPQEYIAAALSPAEVIYVEMISERSCRAEVNPDQFSLAIGKEGQNVRLAARLTGCKIDIVPGV